MDETAPIAARFEAVFERIREDRMEGVPVLNPALRVAMIGLRAWNDLHAGILVTPWFINAVLVGAEGEGAAVAPGTKKRFRLPAGPFEFIRSHEDDLGGFWMCSLFSPVFEFPDQETALAVAEAAFAALMDGEAADGEEDGDMERIWRGELPETGADLPDGGQAAVNSSGEPKAVSRRAFLTAARERGEPA